MVKVLDFLVRKENRGDVQCKFIWKDYQKNEFSENPKIQQLLQKHEVNISIFATDEGIGKKFGQ